MLYDYDQGYRYLPDVSLDHGLIQGRCNLGLSGMEKNIYSNVKKPEGKVLCQDSETYGHPSDN